MFKLAGRWSPCVPATLVLAAFMACSDPSPEAALLAGARKLVRSAEAEPSPLDRVPLLEDARANLHRIVGFHRSTAIASALVEGHEAGGLSLEAVERALREARMDVCRAAPNYRCLVDSAVAAVASEEYLVWALGRDNPFVPGYEGERGYGTIATALARAGDVQGALALLDRLIERGFGDSDRVRTLMGHVAQVQAATGDPQGATQTAQPAFSIERRYREHRPESLLWSAIAVAHAAAGDFDAAMEAIDSIWTEPVGLGAPQANRPLIGPRRGLLRSYALTQIGLARARSGGVADALTTLADAANDVIGRLGDAHHGMGRRILATAARTSLEAGDVATAEDMVARAHAATEQLADYLRPVHLVDVAWVWASIDRPDRAARALAAAHAAYRERDERPGRRQDPARVIEGMADIGKGWALVGDLAMARMLRDSVMELVAEMNAETEYPRTLYGLSEFQAALVALESEADDLDAARRTATQIDSTTRHHRTAHHYIAAATVRNSPDPRRIIDALPGELHPYYEATLWREVASARADAGNLDAAREAFGEAIEAASRIEGPPPLRFPEQWTPGPYHDIEDFLAGLGNAGYGLWYYDSAHPRGWALRSIACAAQAAGLRLPPAALHRAATASDPARYDAASWTMQAVAVILLGRPCPDERSPSSDLITPHSPAPAFVPPPSPGAGL